MELHYNAFISYRHSPVDSKVAAEIQHQLEHFHIPGAIRKRTGVKRINRIFRDKEELPITSDLNEDITRALEHADYLIVICSPRTEESTWVRREIETFLRTHSRRQVLTVLAEGEPEDTIPDLLRYDESTDPETGEVRRVPVEPLSCDYRGSIRTARREELPRLAASLLGCGYDELRQRQRQYKARRLTAILAGVLCLSLAFTAYFIRTSLVIQDRNRQLSESNQLLEESYRQVEENYQQALRNQSEYLAAESLAALEEGDRLLAIQLALAALPGEGNDRPVLPRAEYALSQAVGAYQTQQAVTATGSFAVDGKVEDYILNEDGTRLIIANSLDMVTVWDTDTYQQLRMLRTEVSDVSQLFLLRDRYLVIGGDQNIQCFDLEDGSELWLCETGLISGLVVVSGETQILATCYDENLLLLDAMTGETVSVITAQEPKDTLNWLSVCYGKRETAQSPDGTLVALVASLYVRDENGEVLGDVERPVVVDLSRGTAEVLPLDYYDISDLCFLSENELAVMGVKDEAESDYYSVYLEEGLKTEVSCVSPDRGELRWTNEIAHHRSYGREKLFFRGDKNALICVFGNTCRQIDTGTGATLGEGADYSPILDIYEYGGENFVTTEDGSYGTFSLEDYGILTFKVFLGELEQVRFNHGGYVLQNDSGRVIQYRSRRDENFNELTDFVASGSISYDSNGDYIAILGQDKLGVLEFSNREFVARMDLTELEGYHDSTLLGLSDENTAYLLIEYEPGVVPEQQILAVDVTTGAYTTEEYHTDDLGSDEKLAGDVLYYWVRDYSGEDRLMGWRIGEGEVFRAPLPDGTSRFYVSEAGNRALLLNESGAAWLYDLSDGSAVALEQPAYSDFPAALSEDGSLAAAADTETIRLWREDGALLAEIPFEAGTIVELRFAPQGDQLLVVDEDGELYRYGLDGRYLGVLTIHYDPFLDKPTRWEWLEDGSLCIRSFRTLSVVDTDDWREILCVDDCIEYDPDSGTLLCAYYEGSQYRFGYYQRYSTEDLIAMGREYVATVEMTQEQKAAYGLG